MPHRLPPDDLETVLAELQEGIIPTSIFSTLSVEKKDPFEGLSSQQARKKKRKWRKLKKKFGVRNKPLSHQAQVVRYQLRRIVDGSRD